MAIDKVGFAAPCSEDAGSCIADEANRRVYADPGVVRYYARASELQPAETTILRTLERDLAGMSMLDIGVGGGRTTAHFAPRVKRYVAIDYSEAMIHAARKRFCSTPYEFVLGDARALPFEQSSFDVVLFSHNGIDYVDHGDRLRCLAEIRRVLWPGGLFVFSTHNLARNDLQLYPRSDEGLLARLRHSPRRARLRSRNPSHEGWSELPYAMVNDGAFSFRASTYHIRPAAQLDQLRHAGFDAVRMFSGAGGDEVARADDDTPNDPWLYFLCRGA